MYEELIDLTSSFLVIFRNIAKKHSITSSQGFILLTIDSRGTSMMGVSNKLGLDASTMTRNIEKLEKKQLVYRERLTSDARVVNVYLTKSGQKLNRVIKEDLQIILRDKVTDKTELTNKLHGLIWDLEKINYI
mgnify:CR=1 FL=1|tara:strand:+ start:254 stop:652 length:399 start_codon:yes stop_codon:yes gene_type:complete